MEAVKKKETKRELQFLRQGKLFDKREGSVNSAHCLHLRIQQLLSHSIVLYHRFCFSLQKKKLLNMDINLISLTKSL